MSDNNPFDYFDKIFCINLDSRPDRWELVQGEFRKVGIFDRVKRVSAYCCKHETKNTMEYSDNVTTLNFPYHIGGHGRFGPAYDIVGQFGCSLSHNKCTKLAMQYNAKNYLVFEDDFYFKNFDEDYLNTCINELPTDWKLFSLGYNGWSQRSIKSYSRNLNKMYGFGLAHAYAINGNMFKHLNNEFEKRVIRSETRRKRWWKRNEYFLGNATKYQYGVKNIFAFQRDGFSNVTGFNKEHTSSVKE